MATPPSKPVIPPRKQIVGKRQMKKGIPLPPRRKVTLVLKKRPFMYSA